ncbi:MAG: CPBP family intramembrane metalloprotease [Muribaculaceae bacterium]|nr:CPBP family intramembrane metalloprotease [Muribaculaceae bacterium]
MNENLPKRRLSLPAALLLLAALVFIGFMLASVALMVLQSLGLLNLESRTHLLWLTVGQDVLAFILPAVVLARFLWQRPCAALRLNVPPSWMALAAVVLMQVIALPAMNWIVDWNAHVVLPTALESVLRPMEDAAALQTELLLNVTNVWQMLAGVLVIGLVAALSEELLFRGAVQGTWMDYSGQRHVAVWGVAILFSAIHLQFYGFVPRMLLGVWFGYLLLWTRSLWVPIIAHFLNNTIVVVSSYIAACNGADENIVDTIGLPALGQLPWVAMVSMVASIALVVLASKYFSRKNDDDFSAL